MIRALNRSLGQGGRAGSDVEQNAIQVLMMNPSAI